MNRTVEDALSEAHCERDALKALVREMVRAIKSSETYECPNGGRNYCLSPHIVDPIINRPEVRVIIEEK